MSLARSFTQRFARKSDKHAVLSPSTHPPPPGRVLIYQAQLKPSKPAPQISLPVHLLSTSNTLAYDAPDLADAQFQHSLQPFGAPEILSNPTSALSSPPACETPSYDAPGLTDASSIEESSPVRPRDSYFPSEPVSPLRSKTLRVASSSSSLSQDLAFERPAIPKRAASHSKREHQRVHRSRSLQRTSVDSHAPSLSSALRSGRSSAGPGTPRDLDPPELALDGEWRTSHEILGRSGSLTDKHRRSPVVQSPRSRSIERSNSARAPKHDNPFSQELEQLEEVAEEFTGLSDQADRDVDEAALISLGLAKYSVDEYLQEIASLRGLFLAGPDTRTALVDVQGAMHGWI